MEKNHKELIFSGFIGVFYIFAVIRTAIIPMNVPVKAWHMLLFALGAFLFHAFVNTRAGRITFLSVVLIGVSFIVYLIVKKGFGSLNVIFSTVIRLINVMARVGSGYYDETISNFWLFCSVGVFTLFVAIPVYYFLMRYFRFYLLIVPGLAFFMIAWGVLRYVDRPSFYIFITVAIVTYIRHNHAARDKKNPGGHETASGIGIMGYFIPVALLIILISSIIPVSQIPIQWPWMDQKINNLWWDLHYKYSVDRYDKFSLASTGFGNANRLGGPVRPDNTPVMVVKAPARVYLRGAVYDRYTGIGWELTKRLRENYNDIRTLEQQELRQGWKAAGLELMLLSREKYDDYLKNGKTLSRWPNLITAEEYFELIRSDQMPEVLSKLYPEEDLSIRHLNIRTKTLFTPLRLILPITGLGYGIEENMEGVFEANKRLPGNSTYEINYLQPAYGMTALENHFYTSSPGMYRRFIDFGERFVGLVDRMRIKNADNVKQEIINRLEIYRQLESRKNEIYNQYTEIPEEVPPRVKQLAGEITARANTSYGKAKAIEEYLRNYTYTLSPQIPPGDLDFVDYFLFEGMEGYCTYYASAMCVMTRAIGIPARYVEGFILPEEPDRYGYYHVSNQNAHAWVEVYLEGVGWVTFEPTAPMAGAMNYTVALEEAQGGSGTNWELPEEFEPEEDIEPNDGLGIDLPDYQRREFSYTTLLLWVIGIIMVVMLVNQMFIALRRMILAFLAPGTSVPFMYQYLVTLLKQAGCELKTGETPRDFALRVDNRFQFAHMSMTEMVEVFYSVRFGRRTPDKKTLKKLFAFSRELKNKSGSSMYFMRRFLLRGMLFQG